MNNIHISNPKLLEEKISKIKSDGSTTFHVVSDFDKTLTPAFINGKKAETGISQLRAGGYLSPEYVEKAYALHAKYYPIEIDETLSIEERSRFMLEWWTEHLKIMIQYGLNKEVIDDIIKKRKLRPREGSLEFYLLLNQLNIPLLIFSAGKGNLIKGFLKQEESLYPNIHIIANFYNFDEKGNVTGYKSNIVHTFNKSEVQLRNHPYSKQIKERKNVMLLGDGIGDLGMTVGIEHDTILRIGFLNENPEKLPLFEKEFDVVITNDGSMEYINNLLKRMFNTH